MEELKTHLLGAPQFEVRLGANLEAVDISLPDSATLTGQGEDWIRYQTANPMQANPLVVEYLVNISLPVIRLAEVPRSLEKAYLQAMSETGKC